MPFIAFFAPAAVAALITYLITPFAGVLAGRIGAVDQPGPRKIHRQPTPRLGGVAVIAGVAVSALGAAVFARGGPWHLPEHLAIGIVLGLLPIVAVSIRDDISPVGAMPKLLVHILGAATAVAFGVSLNADVHLFGRTIAIGPLAFPLSVLWLTGTTSAFNIVDGLDGLAAGLALISAAALTGIFMLANQTVMAAAALTIAGGVAGFLPYNLFPARMFFGDTGATAIGFCLGAFALRGGATLSAGFAALVPVFVLGLPIAETLISMARRLVRRFERHEGGGIFDADRNHMHHRLLALGIDHPRAVLILYAVGAVLAAAALVSMLLSARESALLVTALVLAGSLGVRRLGYDEFALIRRGVVLKAYEAPALNRSMFVMFVDVVIVAAAALVAVAIKADWRVAAASGDAIALTALMAPLTIVVCWRMGIYRQTWRLAGVDEFARACTTVIVTALIAATVRTLFAMAQPSLSLLALFATVHLVLLVACRASYQVLAASGWRVGVCGAPILIYGAGRRGVTALCELAANADSRWRPVAFIDDDPAKQDTVVRGLPVVGTFATIERTLRHFAVRGIVVATDALPAPRLAELNRLCSSGGIALLQLHVSFDAIAAAMMMPLPQAAPVHEVVVPVRRSRYATAMPDRCPVCSSERVHRSHVRRVSERVRKHLTQKRLYRCEDCGWRGWAGMIDAVAFEPLPTLPSLPPLDGIDSVMHQYPLGLRAS